MEIVNNIKYFYSMSDLVKLYESNDYKIRMIAEYMDLYQKVSKMRCFLLKVDLGLNNAVDDFYVSLMHDQYRAMSEYLSKLEKRLIFLECEIPECYFSVKGLDI